MEHYAVRRIALEDIDPWWELRLKALREHPDAFGSDYETSRNSGHKYAERGYFDGGLLTLFGAYTPDGTIVAQAGVFAESGKRSHIANIISVYAHPDHRGHGLAARLVQAAIVHLRGFPHITSIRLSVNSTNYPARTVYEKLGFVAWGEEPDSIGLPDGSMHAQLHMVLKQE